MKHLLVFIYLGFFITIAVVSTHSDAAREYPLWFVISGVVFPALGSISILLYGLNYHPKRFVAVWKVIPFALLGYYVLSFYLGIFVFGELDDVSSMSAVGIVSVAVILLLPAFYLSFRFGYLNSKEKNITVDDSFSDKNIRGQKKKRRFVTLIVIIVCTGLYEISFRYVVGHFGEVNTDTRPISLYYIPDIFLGRKVFKTIYFPREKIPLPLGKVRLSRGTGAYIESGIIYRKTTAGWENVTEAFSRRKPTKIFFNKPIQSNGDSSLSKDPD